jgi:transposase
VACPHDDTIVSAPTPPQLIERGKLGPVLVIESLSEKYIDHQPIERQSRRWTRTGVEVSPQTLGRSVAAAIDLLVPVADETRKQTLAASLLATDSTGLRVLDEDVPDGIRNGTMWCWIGDQRWVTFFYTPNGDSDAVRGFLGDQLRRIVQCDGTSLTSFLERAGGKRPGCWSHGRRRLVACARAGDALALEGLRVIRRIFAVDRLSALHHETAEQRHERRARDTAPVIAELRAWVDQHRATIPPKTAMGKALGYLHRQWARLVLFLDDGRIELTNNRVERELRALVLGRKNWLFATGDLGGERTATILTLIGTCISQRVNPRAYLHLVTKLLIDGWPQKRLRDLLPDRLAQAHPELRLPPPPPLPPSTPLLSSSTGSPS